MASGEEARQTCAAIQCRTQHMGKDNAPQESDGLDGRLWKSIQRCVQSDGCTATVWRQPLLENNRRQGHSAGTGRALVPRLQTEGGEMKFLASLIALLFLCTLSHAQVGGALAPPPMSNPYPMNGNPEHAAQHTLGEEQSLLPSNGVTSAHGERPLSDFYTHPEPTVSLGQIAREYREGREVHRPISRVIP